ncbi:MAG: hypothetical protein WKG07_02580 [Hymenobacter sp.]
MCRHHAYPLTSASDASGGTGPVTYQWDSSPDNTTWTPIGGATGATYAPGALTATTYFRRRVNASGACAPGRIQRGGYYRNPGAKRLAASRPTRPSA